MKNPAARWSTGWRAGRSAFLVVKNKNGRHWGFPKGHMEYGESERQTALREVLEETGLKVEILPGFRETCEYCPYGSIKSRWCFSPRKAAAGSGDPKVGD